MESYILSNLERMFGNSDNIETKTIITNRT